MAGFLERLSRVTVLLSVACALALETWLGAREWPALLPWTAGVFVAIVLIARVSSVTAWATVLGVAYLMPAVFMAAIGRSLTAYQTIWMAALFAVVVARTDWSRWALPTLWKLPLAYWALVVALSWPIVVAREADFRWWLLSYYHIGNSGLGGPPAVGAVMIANVALTQLLGLICFDQFFAVFTDAGARFKKVVLLPLAASAAAGAAMAVYQGLVNVSWLSGHRWPGEHRAAGGFVDGDAAGFLSAFWSSAYLALVNPSPTGLIVGVAGSALAWAGLWASGSRMALVAGALCLAFLIVFGLRVARWRASILAVVAIACVAVGLTVTGAVRWSSVSPLKRTLDSLPALSRQSLITFAKTELYDRYLPYGTASLMMVEQYPITGVGVAGYYQMFPDYTYVIMTNRARAEFDNAQSWYRHQLAELGVLGSLGWIWWAATMGWLLVSTRGDDSEKFAAGVVKGTLVTTALVSLVSMPTQLAPLALSVWVFAFWYISLSTKAQHKLQGAKWMAGSGPWLVLWLLASGFAIDTYWIAHSALRPPYRAVMADWNYEHGFYEPEKVSQGDPYRWTTDETVSVFPAKGRYLKLTVWVHHPDVADRPVDVHIWRKGQPIASVTLHDASPVTWYVRADPKQQQMMIETRVSRTWRPADFGQRDGRVLGLGIADWSFVEQPPAGAQIID